MTRANLNFIWQNPGGMPRTLFHYHNGDQYPEGLLQFFGLEDFLTIDHLWTPEDFRAWIQKNYREASRKLVNLGNGLTMDAHAESDEPAEPEDLGEGGQPRVYYTEGFSTDYSYVFSHHHVPGRKRKDGTRPLREQNWVQAWNWDKLIFSGGAKQFLRFCQKRVKPAVIPPEVKMFSAVSAALGFPA